MSVNAVLFDFGMVLSTPPNPAIWNEMKTVAQLQEPAFHRGYWSWRDDYDSGMLNYQAYWSRIAADASTSFSEETVRRLANLDVALWTDLNTPMIEWVRSLHRAGVRTGILSNMPDAMADGIRDKFDWIGDFHHVVWSHALKMRKPQVEIYAASASGLDLPPEQILFVDDKPENIEAAIAFGMQGIVYSDHTTFQREMRERGFGYLLDVPQLTSVL